MGALLYLVLITLCIAVVTLLARSRAKADPKTRGTKPGFGDQLIDMSYGTGGPGGGHSAVICVTRDPQKYAKAMMPKSNKGNDK